MQRMPWTNKMQRLVRSTSELVRALYFNTQVCLGKPTTFNTEHSADGEPLITNSLELLQVTSSFQKKEHAWQLLHSHPLYVVS